MVVVVVVIVEAVVSDGYGGCCDVGCGGCSGWWLWWPWCGGEMVVVGGGINGCGYIFDGGAV